MELLVDSLDGLKEGVMDVEQADLVLELRLILMDLPVAALQLDLRDGVLNLPRKLDDHLRLPAAGLKLTVHVGNGIILLSFDVDHRKACLAGLKKQRSPAGIHAFSDGIFIIKRSTAKFNGK